jgi:hypothetical protein
MRRVGRLTAVTVGAALLATACYVPYDFTGDGKADLVGIDGQGVWWNGTTQLYVGQVGDWPVAGNYDGNGTWEAAVVRGDQWITQGKAGTITYPPPPVLDVPQGSTPPLIVPVPADYDGDGKPDPAWYREADATWWISTNSGPVTFGTPYHTGLPDYDVPVPADYDGDGKADIATYSPATATWHVMGQPDVQLGGVGDVPVPADYDGVKGDERATFDFFQSVFHITGQGDVSLPVLDNDSSMGEEAAPADYDGVGHAEPAVKAWGTGHWYIAGQPMISTSITKVPAAGGVADRAPVGGSVGVYLRLTELKKCLIYGLYCPAS